MALIELKDVVGGYGGAPILNGVNMAIDGSYGPQTTQAVKNFQAAYGLSADGVAGPNTVAKIYTDNLFCSPFGSELCVTPFAAAAFEDDLVLEKSGFNRLQPA